MSSAQFSLELAAARMRALLERASELEGKKLSDAIPSDCFSLQVWRGVLGLFVSYGLWAAGLWAVSMAPHWLWYIPAWLVSGLGGWGLHCIAHDCGHGSFSSSRRFNAVVGQIALLPLLYPYHAWRHVHNLHHANTNSLEKDTDWRPIDRATYSRMGAWDRAVYLGTRSAFFWLGTVHYQYVSMRPSLYPASAARAEVRRANLTVLLFATIALTLLFLYTGPIGLLKYGLAPWVAIHVWFSTTTLMHHTSPELPFLDRKRWTKNASKLLLTTDFRYPRWLHFLTHNIATHTAHHVAPKIPFYNLPRAQAALKRSYPEALRERDLSVRAVWRAVSGCHFYDPGTGYYHGIGETAAMVDVLRKVEPTH